MKTINKKMGKNKNKIYGLLALCIVLITLSIAANIDREKFVLVDTELVDTDTILVGPISIGSTPNVAFMLHCSDSVKARVDPYFSYGSQQRKLTDSLSQGTDSSNVPLSVGKVLRGYGLASDLIPGGNTLYFKVYAWNITAVGAGSASEYIKVSLITAK